MKWTKQRLNNLFFLLGIAAVVVMLLTFDVSFIECRLLADTDCWHLDCGLRSERLRLESHHRR